MLSRFLVITIIGFGVFSCKPSKALKESPTTAAPLVVETPATYEKKILPPTNLDNKETVEIATTRNTTLTLPCASLLMQLEFVKKDRWLLIYQKNEEANGDSRLVTQETADKVINKCQLTYVKKDELASNRPKPKSVKTTEPDFWESMVDLNQMIEKYSDEGEIQ